MKALDEKSALEQKYQELRAKKLELDSKRVDFDLKNLHQREENLKLAKEADYGVMNDTQVETLMVKNRDYIEAARGKTRFIDKVFDDVVPFFKKNIILVCGGTGAGKSTCVSNIVRHTIAQKNNDGTHKKILIITNEQAPEDFYNSVVCQINGWNYTNHDKFTDEQVVVFNKYIKFLAGSGLITVIDDAYNGTMGVTTTIEGIRAIFDNLIAKKHYYDVILIDYYQLIKGSTENPKLNQYEAQAMFAAMIDNYKNIYPAPIVVMAQVKPNREDEDQPLQYRLAGTKAILDKATLVIELEAERQMLRTKWHVHKSRFTEGAVGVDYYTGYEKGQYVSYDAAFREKVAEFQQKRQAELMDRMSGQAINRKIEDGNEENSNS